MKLSLSRAILALLVGATASNAADPDQPCETFFPADYASGETTSASTSFSQEGASFIQLDLRGTTLAPGAQLVLSGENGEEWLDSENIGEFSGELNGSTVTLELITAPGGGASSVVVDQIKAGICDEDPNAASICGPVDDRTPSTDDRQGRMGGCTAWLIARDAFVWAGHCGTPNSSTRLHFTYSQSSAPSDKQYAVDVGSYTGVNGGVGNDWGVGKLLPNSQTQQLPGDAQGGWYNIGTVPATTAGQHIRITGYGVASVASRSQKTHVGDLVAINSNNLRYVPDTTGGNSGSPVVHEETGDAIGVHTHGGCSSSGGSNIGTSIANAAFKAAVDAVAAPPGPPAPTPPPVPTDPPAPTSFYEAEDAELGGGTSVKSNHAGFSGTGYADMGGINSFIEFSGIDGGSGGDCTLTFKYAQGGAPTRPCTIEVNGSMAGTVQFARTSGWAAWTEAEIVAQCAAGENKVRVTAATGNGGPNVDGVDVQTTGTPPSPPTGPSPTPPPVPSPTPPPVTPCVECTNKKTRWMKKRGKNCWTASKVIERQCNESERWIENEYCMKSCFVAGRGYDGVECCTSGNSALSADEDDFYTD